MRSIYEAKTHADKFEMFKAAVIVGLQIRLLLTEFDSLIVGERIFSVKVCRLVVGCLPGTPSRVNVTAEYARTQGRKDAFLRSM